MKPYDISFVKCFRYINKIGILLLPFVVSSPFLFSVTGRCVDVRLFFVLR